MITKEKVNEINLLIKRDRLILALAEMKKLSTDRRIIKEIHLISSRLSALEHKSRTGQIDFKEEEVVRNQIRASVLQVFELVEHPEILISDQKRRKLLRRSAGFVLLILLVSLLFRPVRESVYYGLFERTATPEEMIVFGANPESPVNQISLTDEGSTLNQPLLKVTEKSQDQLTFSISSQFDRQELTELFLKVKRMHRCDELEIPPGQEGILVNLGLPDENNPIFINEYEIILAPYIQHYRLLPKTVKNVKDTWVFDKGEISKFFVNLKSEGVVSADIVIQALFVDHINGTENLLTSEVVRYESRDCEGRLLLQKEVIQDGKLRMSPFLYKLITCIDFTRKINPADEQHRTLCQNALREITEIFEIENESLEALYTDRSTEGRWFGERICLGETKQHPLCLPVSDLSSLEKKILSKGLAIYRILYPKEPEEDIQIEPEDPDN